MAFPLSIFPLTAFYNIFSHLSSRLTTLSFRLTIIAFPFNSILSSTLSFSNVSFLYFLFAFSFDCFKQSSPILLCLFSVYDNIIFFTFSFFIGSTFSELYYGVFPSFILLPLRLYLLGLRSLRFYFLALALSRYLFTIC